jgi:hypothetical protein
VTDPRARYVTSCRTQANPYPRRYSSTLPCRTPGTGHEPHQLFLCLRRAQEYSSTCLRVVLAACGGLNLRALELEFFQGNQNKNKVGTCDLS